MYLLKIKIQCIYIKIINNIFILIYDIISFAISKVLMEFCQPISLIGT